MFGISRPVACRIAVAIGCAWTLAAAARFAGGQDGKGTNGESARYIVVVIGFGGRIDKVLGTFPTYAAGGAVAHNWSVTHPDDLRLAWTWEIGKHRLGSLSKKFEAAKRGPRAVSCGKIKQKVKATGKSTIVDDPGGKSYGSFQLASKRGIGGSSVTAFATKYYPEDFAGTTPGTNEFGKKWNEVVNRDPEAFEENERQFIKDTHYDPVAKALQEKLGLDLDSRSGALRDVVWSTAVQHGPPEDPNGHAVPLLIKAMDKWSSGPNPDWSKVSDADLIKAIYGERGRKGNNGKLVHFPGLTHLDRFDQEQRNALDELSDELSPKTLSSPLP